MLNKFVLVREFFKLLISLMLPGATAAIKSPVPPLRHGAMYPLTLASVSNPAMLVLNPAELPRVIESQSQAKYKIGTTIDKMIATRNPRRPRKKRKTHEKYIKCLHLYLSQNVMRTTPSKAKQERPNMIP